MAAKSRASTSSAALAEILGIADSGSATPVTLSSVPTSYPPTPFEADPSTSSSDPSGTATPAEEIRLQELTVSSKSVMDYFKEKLAAKSRPTSSPGTPAPAEEADGYDERPRMGLGASSRLRQEISLEVEERRGLGGIGSGSRMSFASMFASATITRPTEVTAEAEGDEAREPTSKKSKDKKDKERKKEKKSKKEKGKEKQADGAEDVEESGAAADEKAERKRRKEEKRRRKEADAQASATRDDEDGDSPNLENAERKGKSKKKSKTDR